MPAVLLVRHGQASFGTADYDVLSERGHEQAAAVHAGLARRGVRPVRLVSGSLRRQRDTAAAWVADGLELAIDPRWDEYDNEAVVAAHGDVAVSLEQRGDAPAMTSREFQAILDPAVERWIAAGDGDGAARTWTAFRTGVTDALAELLASLGRGETAIVVSSAGTIATAVVVAAGLPDTAMVAFNRVGINSGVTKLVGGRSGLSLVSFNEHAHLEPDLVTYR